MTKRFHVHTSAEHDNSEITTVIKKSVLQLAEGTFTQQTSLRKNTQVKQLTELAQRHTTWTHPHAHVERDDGDADVLCGFSVHVREL